MNTKATRLSKDIYSRLLILLVSMAGTSCGVSPKDGPSYTKDVATDMDGTAVSGDVRLYYQDGANLVEGKCTVGLPALRTNCQGQLRKVALAAFTAELLKTVQSAADVQSATVTTLTSQFNAAQSSTATALASQADLTSRKGNTEGAINDLTTKLAAAKTQASALLDQISAIEENLLQGPNADLTAQKTQLKGELKKVQDSQVVLSQQLGTQKAALVDITNQITALGNVAAMVTNRDQLAASLATAKVTLTQRQTDLAQAQDTIAKISEDITYEVLSGNGDFAKNRPYVRQFKAVFDKVLVPPPPPGPAQGDLKLDANGLLFFFNAGTWGGVCDDAFTNLAARVACKQMGQPSANATFVAAQGGPGSPFALDNTVCTGAEANLSSCQHAPLGASDCISNEYIKLVCQ